MAIHKLRVANFFSIGEEVELDLTATTAIARKYGGFSKRPAGKRGRSWTSCVTGIFGPNAAGKTNVLKSLSFLRWFLTNPRSLNEGIPFFVHTLHREAPASFSVDFDSPDHEGLFTYELKCRNDEVVSEALSVLSLKEGKKRRRRTVLFKRQDQKLDVKGLGLNPEQCVPPRKTVSFVAANGETTEGLGERLQSIFFGMEALGNVSVTGLHDGGGISWQMMKKAEGLYHDPALCEDLSAFLESCDFGITSLEVQKKEAPVPETEERSSYVPVLTISRGELSFKNPALLESDGTKHVISIFPDVKEVLEKGGIYVFDTLDAHLHPEVQEEILSLFLSEDTNPKGAQLLFSSHNHQLMDRLEKSQIYLTQKQENLETDLYSLNDIEGVGQREVFSRKYLSGTYGAVPEM